MQEQLELMRQQLEAATKAKQEEAERVKADAAKDAQEQLTAEADLKALLAGGDKDVETTKKDRVEDMSNAEMLDLISTAVETVISANTKQASHAVDEKLKATNETVDKLTQILVQMQASAGVDRARVTYKDFDKVKDDTLAVLNKYKMMEVEDAYLLAKAIRAKGSPPKHETDTERPDNIPGGPLGLRRPEEKASTKDTPVAQGVVGFRQLVNAAIEAHPLKSEER